MSSASNRPTFAVLLLSLLLAANAVFVFVAGAKVIHQGPVTTVAGVAPQSIAVQPTTTWSCSTNFNPVDGSTPVTDSASVSTCALIGDKQLADIVADRLRPLLERAAAAAEAASKAAAAATASSADVRMLFGAPKAKPIAPPTVHGMKRGPQRPPIRPSTVPVEPVEPIAPPTDHGMASGPPWRPIRPYTVPVEPRPIYMLIGKRMHAFYAHDEKLTWGLAYKKCRANGQRLARILDQRTLHTLGSALNKRMWIAANDFLVNGEFEWDFDAGAEVQWSHWDVGEPSRHPMERCVESRANGMWNDLPCSTQIGYLCEQTTAIS